MSDSVTVRSSPIPSSSPPAVVSPPGTPHSAALLTLLTFVVVVLALYFARDVMVPITLAVLLSFLLAPLVGVLRHWHLPPVAAVLVSIAGSLGIILALGGLIGAQVADLATDLPRYQPTIEAKAHLVQDYSAGWLLRLSEQVRPVLPTPAAPPKPTAKAPPTGTSTGTPTGTSTGTSTGAPAGISNGTPADQKPIAVQVQPPPESPTTIAERLIEPILGPLATTGITFVVAIFILMQQEDLRDRLIRLFGSTDLHRTTMALDDAGRRLSRYFLTQLAINAGFGVVIFGGLAVIGVPNAALWAILSTLMRFVPYIGTWISGALPILLAAAVDPGWSMALWTLGLYVVADLIAGQIVEPVLYGHSTGLSPVSVVVAAVFWSWLWGPIGLILSTPLTLCLVVLGRHVSHLEFLDVILGDRPALTPVESFYQRILAGDADEALDQAETLLKDRPLSSYYDEVALEGVRMATADVARGVLPPDKAERVRTTVLDLIADLASHDDQPPVSEQLIPSAVALPARETDIPSRPVAGPDFQRDGAREPWDAEQPIVCIAGRGPLDDTAAGMLAQLLVKHGLGARTAPHSVIGRAGVSTLDRTEVAMVCLCYLEIEGVTSHLRYALRRVRQQLPGVPLLVGFWPQGEAVLHDERLRQAIGADVTAATLTDAVNLCLRAAAAGRPVAVADQVSVEA